MSPTPMEALLTQLGYVVSSVMGWITNATDGIAATIVNTPLLLVTTGFLVLGKLHTAEFKLGKIGESLFRDNAEVSLAIA